MDITYLQFLQIIKCSLYKDSINFTKNEKVNWENIFNLANIHKVLPMIYESVYKNENFKNNDEIIQKALKSKTMQITLGQYYRSERFLALYKEFLKENIKVIVFKGIILRNLYPIPEERTSSDEDILINKEDILKCEEILLKNNFQKILCKDEEQDVYHYHCCKTGLHLEIHTSLFSEGLRNSSHMNKIFNNAFEDMDIININNTDIYTFSLDKHFLYVICHAIKHFLSCGIGIRQICDINIYINTYYKNISWEYIWEEMYFLRYETLFVNILQICIDYLGLDEKKIKYAKNKGSYYINTDELLEDIIEGGIYGSSSQSRLNSANMSLDAVNRGSKFKLKSNLSAIFPSIDYLRDTYEYLNKYPILLPIAWYSRIFTYTKKIGGIANASKGVKETVLLGNKRIDLLKKYNIID